MQQRAIPNNPPSPQRQTPWQMFKSFAFRILMIYFVTRFFRQPAKVNPTGNETLQVIPTISNLGSLYKTGDLLVRIFPHLIF